MLIQSIAIASEILDGATVNTNSTFASQTLKKQALEVSRHLVIGDDEKSIESELKAALDRFDLTIISGGLGPTLDDLTKDVACRLVGSKLEKNELVFKDLKERFPHLSTIESQSKQIKGAFLLKNSLGTAYGFILSKAGRYLAFLPGVPQEFEAMLSHELIPWLKERFQETQVYTKNYLVFSKREHELDPLLRQIQDSCKELKIGIYPNYGYLNIHLLSKNPQSLNHQAKILEENLKGFLLENCKNPAEALHQILKSQKISLSIAESCTGGEVSKKITALSEASQFFQGSIVAYSNEVKKNILKIDPSILVHHGAVSAECAKEMAIQVKKLFSTDLALAVTGIAGPSGGSNEKPVGTVFLSIAYRHEVYVVKLPSLPYSKRDIITAYASNYLFGLAYQLLAFKKAPF